MSIRLIYKLHGTTSQSSHVVHCVSRTGVTRGRMGGGFRQVSFGWPVSALVTRKIIDNLLILSMGEASALKLSMSLS